MSYFSYNQGELFAEQVAVETIAQRFGTPAYVYSKAAICDRWNAYNDAFGDHPHLVCYAVKANSNIGILSVLAKLGSGFDIVSGGELQRVLRAGGNAKKIVFSGVGKTESEMRLALASGIKCFNVESESELHRLNRVAAVMGVKAPVSLRVNPDVDAMTHPYISTGLQENKFGVGVDDALRIYKDAAALENIAVHGIDCHIGSQLTETQPLIDALDRVLGLVEQIEAEGIQLEHIDLGGGLGIKYNDETPTEPGEYVQQVLAHLGDRNYEILMEPGRSIVGNAGIFVTKVEFLKSNGDKHFAIIDGAMNDLIRPALYSAWQDIQPVKENPNASSESYDVVGPVCETGDFLGKDRKLAIAEGDLLAVFSSGAYGFTMASNYNTRPRSVEVLVSGDQMQVIRERESFEQLIQGEHVPE